MLHGLLKKKFKKGTTINDVQFNLYYDLIETQDIVTKKIFKNYFI